MSRKARCRELQCIRACTALDQRYPSAGITVALQFGYILVGQLVPVDLLAEAALIDRQHRRAVRHTFFVQIKFVVVEVLDRLDLDVTCTHIQRIVVVRRGRCIIAVKDDIRQVRRICAVIITEFDHIAMHDPRSCRRVTVSTVNRARRRPIPDNRAARDDDLVITEITRRCTVATVDLACNHGRRRCTGRSANRTTRDGDIVVLHITRTGSIAAIDLVNRTACDGDAVACLDRLAVNRARTTNNARIGRIRDSTAVDPFDRMCDSTIFLCPRDREIVFLHIARRTLVLSAVCRRNACCETLDFQIVIQRWMICVMRNTAVELCRPVRQRYHRRRCRKGMNDTPVPITVVVENHRICRSRIIVRTQCRLMR